MTSLPPLKLIEQWRLDGLSAQEIYAKCQEIEQARRQSEREGWLNQHQATEKDLAEIEACEGCKTSPEARGLCHLHYNRLWRRVGKRGNGQP